MSQAQQPTQIRRVDMPLADRQMQLRAFKRRDAEEGDPAGDDPLPALATAEMVFTTGAPVLRYDWANDRYYQEVLVVEDGAMRLGRLEAGAPLLNTHDSWELEAVLGNVRSPRIEKGQGVCDVTFSRRPSVAGYVQDVADGIIHSVSVGYVRHRIEMNAPDDMGGTWIYRVTDWEPMEVSLVPIPADPGAQMRSDGTRPAPEHQARKYPCDCIEIRKQPDSAHGGRTAEPSTQGETMDPNQAAGGAPADPTNQARTPAAGAPAVQPSDEAQRAAAAERQRAADITSICLRHSVPADKLNKFVADGTSLDAVTRQILDEIAERDAGAGQRGANVSPRIYTVSDETVTRMAGIEEALGQRLQLTAAKDLSDNGRQYRGMSMLEIGREHLERSGINTRGMDRYALAGQILMVREGGMMGTGDFSSLLANLMNKRLRRAYDENQPSYMRWARRAPDAPDFKSMTIVNLGSTPDLLPVNEHGEFKYASMSDGKETYALTTFGRIVSFSRQALINDDLRGFDRLVGGFGNSAARLENRTVYGILTANAALSDTIALFHASHGNLAGSGAVIAVAPLNAGRKSMRVQKGLQSEELNIAPKFLIVPAAQEQVAYQYTSANYVPTQPSLVNEYRAGGRTALEVVVESVLDASSTTSWYLAADSAQVDTVEYCYLEGADGPFIDQQIGFDVDGLKLKCRLDFAAKAIDFRGLYKDPGA